VIINQNVKESVSDSHSHTNSATWFFGSPALDEEKASHRFASALPNAPRGAVGGGRESRTSISIRELFQIKQMFGVSVQAISYRCKDLGIFSEGLHRNLFKLLHEQGWPVRHSQKPNPIQPEIRNDLERLCYRAMSEGLCRKQKLLSSSHLGA